MLIQELIAIYKLVNMVEEEIIAKMTSDYHKNLRDEYAGSINGSKRDKFRRNLAHQVKVYDIFDIEP